MTMDVGQSLLNGSKNPSVIIEIALTFSDRTWQRLIISGLPVNLPELVQARRCVERLLDNVSLRRALNTQLDITHNGVYNAYRRMIKFRYGRIEVECATEEEATHVFQQMLAEDEKRRLRNRSVLEVAIASVISNDKSDAASWTGELFWKFIDSLGDTQKRVLSALVLKRSLSDKELRQLLKLDDNKQLAGVLSGISKQAAAHNVCARSVFRIENESKSGEIAKTYAVSLDFLRLANEMNWPDEGDSTA